LQPKPCLLILLFLLCFSPKSNGQDNTVADKVLSFPNRLLAKIQKKSKDVEAGLTKQTEKYLQRLARQEAKIQQKLYGLDSNAAKRVFDKSQAQYVALINKIKNETGENVGKAGGQYMPYLDSLKGGLSFLQQDKSAAAILYGTGLSNINSSLAQVNQLQGKLQDAELVKQFIRERKQQITDALSGYTNLPGGVNGIMGDYNKQLYYYSAQVQQYKELLNNPDKMEQKALQLMNQLPAFQDFMKQHSALAGLFSLPGNYGSADGLAGLQTKDMIAELITNQMGGSANAGQLFGQQLGAAQQQLDQFKSKLSSLGGNSGDIDMPDFKPKSLKTKTFFQRLEYGTNLQTQRSNLFFPTTSDLALSVGYKLSKKSIVGIGMSYKLGWGKDIQHVAFSSQGIGVRSYADIQMKKSFYASGGFEYNYQQPFYSFAVVNNISGWQQSGLIGVSKIVSMKTKVFKKTKLQFLWDFLSYQQIPRAQPIKFRVGYSF
jgi:hypothetical protein